MRLETLINKYHQTLNENDLHILKYVLNNQQSCHKLGISELAMRCNVSRSTVLRCTQKLGFTGYSEFKVYLKWQAENDEVSAEDFTTQFQLDIEKTLNHLKKYNFTDICDLIHESKRIFVYGTGTAQNHVAAELKRMFLAVDRYIYSINAVREFEMLSTSLTEHDVVIFVSLSGESEETLHIARTLTTRGIPLLSFTSLRNNTLSSLTPYNLYAHTEEIYLAGERNIDTFSSFFITGEMLFRSYVQYKRELEEKQHEKTAK